MVRLRIPSSLEREHHRGEKNIDMDTTILRKMAQKAKRRRHSSPFRTSKPYLCPSPDTICAHPWLNTIEATGRFELPHKGFADLSLTTWVRRRLLSRSINAPMVTNRGQKSNRQNSDVPSVTLKLLSVLCVSRQVKSIRKKVRIFPMANPASSYGPACCR